MPQNVFQYLGPITLALEPDIENEILDELADEIADEFYEIIDDAFPGGQTPLTEKLEGAWRLLSYLKQTEPADLVHLLNPDYVQHHREGLVPDPVSPYWKMLLFEMPREFELDQKDFVSLMKREVGR